MSRTEKILSLVYEGAGKEGAPSMKPDQLGRLVYCPHRFLLQFLDDRELHPTVLLQQSSSLLSIYSTSCTVLRVVVMVYEYPINTYSYSITARMMGDG